MDKSVRLGIVTTHPIQYQAPLFRALNDRKDIDPIVFFHHLPDAEQQGEGFGTAFTWDLPLLEGYRWKIMERNASGGGSNSCVQPTFSNFGEAYSTVDVMLIHGWQSSYMWRAWVSGIISGAPLLVRGDSNAMRDRPWLISQIHQWYLCPFQRYVYTGESNKQFYQNAGAQEWELCPGLHCVENERFDKDWKELKPKRDMLRHQFKIEKDATCFMFCGKFIDKKRPGDIVEAFLKAQSQSDAPMHLLMVGDGKRKALVEAQIPDHVPITFTGFLNQTEIGAAYAAADVVVLPSNYGETWGLVINEAMVFSTAALISDRVGCGPDLITEGKTGFTFPFGDIEAFASRMESMAEAPEQTAEMGRQARNRVCSRYTVERAAEGIASAAFDSHRSS